MGIREARRRARRGELLDHAMDIVTTEGAAALTIARLAARMDASVGGLYRYFPSKEAILIALQERAITGFAEVLAAAAGKTTDSIERLRAVFRAYLGHASTHPEEHRMIVEFLSLARPILSDEEARRVNTSIRVLTDTCATWLDEAVAEGRLSPGDSTQRVHIAWALVHGLDHFRRRDRIQPESLKASQLLEAAFTALLRGWSTHPD